MTRVCGMFLWYFFYLASWVFLSATGSLSNSTTSKRISNWSKIAKQVNKADVTAIKTVFEAWSGRNLDFFRDLEPKGIEAWLDYDIKRSIVKDNQNTPHNYLMNTLDENELSAMKPEACAVLFKHLNFLTNLRPIPKKCWGLFLSNTTKISIDSIRKIPSDWLKEASDEFIRNLTSYHLNNLKVDTFSFLVRSGRCRFLDPGALSTLDKAYWLKITPECLVSIEGFHRVELSQEILANLRTDLFSLYNRPLHQLTTRALTLEQVKAYGSEIPDDQLICTYLCLENLTFEMLTMITPRCLHDNLLKNVGCRGNLREQWPALESPFMQFTHDMMDVAGKISKNDYKWMNHNIIEKIFTRKEAIQSIAASLTNPQISTIAKNVKLLAHHYKFLVDSSGIMAGIFIKEAEVLPDDVFAYFEAEDYSKLEVITSRRLLKGNDVIDLLLKQRPNFSRIVSNFSMLAKSHYCATLRTKKDYLEKVWLREYSGPFCWKALPMDLYLELHSQALELQRGVYDWSHFVRENTSIWATLQPQVLKDFLRMNSFCAAYAPLAGVNFLRLQPNSVLKVISPECVAHFHQLISESLACKLAIDAFSFFTASMFLPRFKFTNLYPAQLGYLSQNLKDKPGLHVFKHSSSKEILSLEEIWLEAVTKSQLKIHFYGNESDTSLIIDGFKRAIDRNESSTLLKFLNLCNSLVKRNGRGRSQCLEAIYGSLSDGGNNIKTLIYKSIPSLSRLSIILSQRATDLRPLVMKSFPTTAQPHLIQLEHDPSSKLDLTEILYILRNQSKKFSNLFTQFYAAGSAFNNGKAETALIRKTLEVIRDRITVVAPGGNSSIRRFSWLVGGDSGFITGLLLGKSLQKNIIVPFDLEEDFWQLLMDPTTLAIDEYYEKTFKGDWKEFCKQRFQQDRLLKTRANSPQYLEPKFLKFLTLNSSSNIDLVSPGGFIIGGGNLDNSFPYETMDEFFQPLHQVIQDEFRNFISKFLKGLGQAVDTQNFGCIPKVSLLRSLFNPSLEDNSLLMAVEFERDLETMMVDSLFPNQKLSVANVIRSYLEVLTLTQQSRLLSMLTGSSSLPSVGNPLKIVALQGNPGSSSNVHGKKSLKDLVPVEIFSGQKEPHVVVGNGLEYFSVLKAVVAVQGRMLGVKSFGPDSFNFLELISDKGETIEAIVAPCFQLLAVHPQPAKALIRSLAKPMVLGLTDIISCYLGTA